MTSEVGSTSTPSYLRRLIQDRQHSHNLRSATTTLCQPSTTTTFVKRAYRCSAPAVWNSLPKTVVNGDTLTEFKTRIKTFLFSQAFSLPSSTLSPMISSATMDMEYPLHLIYLLAKPPNYIGNSSLRSKQREHYQNGLVLVRKKSCPLSVLVQHLSEDGDEADPRWILRWTTNWRANDYEPSLLLMTSSCWPLRGQNYKSWWIA